MLFNNVITIIEGIYIIFNITNNYKYVKVFKLLIYLSVKVYIAVLPKGLYIYNLLLLKGPFRFKVIVFYKVFIEFLFRLLRNFERAIININK